MLDNNKVGTGGSSVEHLKIKIPDDKEASNFAYQDAQEVMLEEGLEEDFTGYGDENRLSYDHSK